MRTVRLSELFTKPNRSLVIYHLMYGKAADQGLPNVYRLARRRERRGPPPRSEPGRNAGRLRQNRELIAAERCRTENIDDVKWVLDEINLRVLPQALTTRSISTQAPSGSAATAITVRAGKG